MILSKFHIISDPPVKDCIKQVISRNTIQEEIVYVKLEKRWWAT